MRQDYFDRVCARPETEIATKMMSVNNLWEKRFEMLTPHKADRLRELYNSLFDLLSEYAETGKRPERLFLTDYWDYVRGYQPRWLDTAGYNARRYLNQKMDAAFRLFDSLKEEGMAEPLCMITEGDHTFLYRGYHRLVVLRVLGVSKAKVKQATVP
jgi:hypothetical protein